MIPPIAALATPAPEATPRPPCLVGIGEVVNDAADPRRYVFGLITPYETTTASGVLSVYAGDRRYDVRFAGARVAGTLDRDAARTPIAVELPDGVVPDGAAVTRTEAPEAAVCRPVLQPWTGPHRALRAPPRFTIPPAAAPALRPAPPVDEPAPRCAFPSAAARTVRAATPIMPPSAEAARASGTTVTMVLLAPNDDILGVGIARSSGRDDLDASALQATSRSLFATGAFRCAPYYGEFLFTVRFVTH